MIGLHQLSFGYGEAPVLSAVSAQASTLVITGPNGAGKSTLLKLILGLLQPGSGTISLPQGRRAAVFQEDRLIEHLTAIGNVRLVAGAVGNSEVEREFEAIGLPSEAWMRPVRELSGGQRRRVCLVRATITQASLSCLDEPFTGIDADSLPMVRGYVRQRTEGRDLAIVTHDEADVVFFGGTRLQLLDAEQRRCE
jgi:NitT/TauT family transport system ATP-binding protein